MDKLVVIFAALFVVTCVFTIARAIQKWRGPSRWLAMLLAAGMFLWALWIVVSVRRDPTSHNLWPLEAVMVAGAASTALVTIALLRPRRPGARSST